MRSERAIVFDCEGARLLGVLHPGAARSRRGVVIVVGGPQYRVGSHRQFVLLARALAAAGIAAMRFDYRGMGDSDGEFKGFEAIGADIAAAMDAFQAELPEIEEVVLWGLCDAASAILFYAHADPRVAGIALLNPWVRTDSGEAKAYIKHYYRGRLADPEFWRKLRSGQMNLASSARSLVAFARRALAGRDRAADAPLLERMAAGLARYRGPVLLILSGKDLTAREFEDAAAASPTWQRLLEDDRLSTARLPSADHTFSRDEWRNAVAGLMLDWLGVANTGVAPGEDIPVRQDDRLQQMPCE